MNKVQSIKVRSIFVADRAWFDPVPVEWEKSVSENTFCFSEWSVEVQAPFELVLHHWSRANLFPKDIIYLTKSWVPATPRQYEERRMAKNDNEYKVAMACIGKLLKSVVYFICFMLTWRSCYRVWNEARFAGQQKNMSHLPWWYWSQTPRTLVIY